MKLILVFKEKGEYYELTRNVVRISWDGNSINYITFTMYSTPIRIHKTLYKGK